MATTDEKTEKINDVELSCMGIDLLVNNDWDGCEKLFTKHKYVDLDID